MSEYTFKYTGGSQTFQVPSSGYYRITCHGAQGGGRQIDGNSYLGIGGKGGYAAGTVYLEKGTSLYIFVGGVGGCSNSSRATGGYNGGGYAWASSNTEPASGGGGATDVRLISGLWDNPQGLLSRIIVAGGGGGGGEDSGDMGGYGGGITGAPGGYDGSGGVFGKGAHTPCDGGGGGGGWIGGNTYSGSQTIPTANDGCDTSGGSGGSGYVYTNTSEVYPGYLVDKKYQMIDALLFGAENDGNGFVSIKPANVGSMIIVNNKCSKCNYASYMAMFLTYSLSGIFILK
jgi:hypothetical protein